ncbi:MAG: type II toxin-antitoxin system CcdA family antitoxin [Thermoproteota archaeon]
MKKCRKKNVVIYLDSEIVKEAKELGLSISKISENALKEIINRIRNEDKRIQ